MGIFASLSRKLFGSAPERRIKKLAPKITAINELENEMLRLSDDALRSKSCEFKQRLALGASLDDLLIEAFAVAREAAKRTLNMRPFDVQLMGAIVLHERGIAEMRTGEGKTLAATLPVYLNALSGKGVHVVTVNDYLAKRDAEHMGQLYNFLGLSTSVITNDLNNEQRRAAYQCDITYATNNELGFDYLRDNMTFSFEQRVQRGHHYALIDEVDSILIDEARTPLIISGALEDRSEYYQLLDAYIPKLERADFEIDEKNRSAHFTDSGIEKLENWLEQDGLLKGSSLYDPENIGFIHHLNNALRAHSLFLHDRDYIVRAGEVVIIDEFTGRMMPGRRYSDGLHQALEAKERIRIQPENQTLASITFQNYFRLYDKLAGMTGTAATEAEEFASIYGLDVATIPTNLPVKRLDEDDVIYRNAEQKYRAIVNDIIEAHKRGQPILVGTTSIEKSESLAKRLRQAKITNYQILNARYHEQEAYIIAQAGKPGAITIATNMAGRGTDIQLGGNLEMRLKQELQAQQAKNSEVSKLDEQKIAEIKADIAKLKEQALQAGGLYVLATERHESRRIDNQLRGRSGRQGDPGRSKFFLSLEDDLMRIFGSERMDAMLARFGLKEDEAIVHPWINKALEKAQKRVEARNFEIRKNLLKYDDVMNDQRRVIFDQRMEVLQSKDLTPLITDIATQLFENLIVNYIPENSYQEQWDLEKLGQILREDFALDLPLASWAEESAGDSQNMIKSIFNALMQKLAEKNQAIEQDHLIDLQRITLLSTIDNLWREHLYQLDQLRSAVGWRGYGQRDPLMEYKSEAFELFQHMLGAIRSQAISRLMRQDFIPIAQEPNNIELNFIHQNPDDAGSGGEEPMAAMMGDMANNANHPFINRKAPQERDPNNPASWGKVGRNESCPCGSLKKYKHCHGKVI